MADTGVSVSDLKTELQNIRKAISDHYTGMSSVSRTGLSYSRAPIEKLEAREKYLVLSIIRSDGGPFVAGEVSGNNDLVDDQNSWNGAGS